MAGGGTRWEAMLKPMSLGAILTILLYGPASAE